MQVWLTLVLVRSTTPSISLSSARGFPTQANGLTLTHKLNISLCLLPQASPSYLLELGSTRQVPISGAMVYMVGVRTKDVGHHTQLLTHLPLAWPTRVSSEYSSKVGDCVLMEFKSQEKGKKPAFGHK